MANPFTLFAFPATGSNQHNRTMPDRISDFHNVKDFGAKGDGVTDDWAAIMAAINWRAAIPSTQFQGTIYFPPGTYLVSQPINLFLSTLNNLSIVLSGEIGVSVITGNFADYIISRASGNGADILVIEGLTITNNNATGGGIRIGGNAAGVAIRDCTVTANQGISTYSSDSGPSYFGAFETIIENCTLNPGSNTSSSQGIMMQSDGPIVNCSLTNFTVGILAASQEGSMEIAGCYFTGCGTGVAINLGPNGGIENAQDSSIIGCWFKNNSIAIRFVSGAVTSGMILAGIYIEASAGQYGIQLGDLNSTNTSVSFSMFAGITVVGTYAVDGIYIPGQSFGVYNTFMGISSVSWSLPTSGTDEGDEFIFCNKTNPITVAQLPTEGEGMTYNVTDGTNSLAWGATVTNTGTHTTHYKVRGNGSNWTVVGQ